MDVRLDEFSAEHVLWKMYVQHLDEMRMTGSALTDSQPRANAYYFGVHLNGCVIGHISLRRQPLTVPASAGNHFRETPLLDNSGLPLSEMFVMTFGVAEAYRQQGYGRRLQEAAITKTKEMGCYQMRSWSSWTNRKTTG